MQSTHKYWAKLCNLITTFSNRIWIKHKWIKYLRLFIINLMPKWFHKNNSINCTQWISIMISCFFSGLICLNFALIEPFQKLVNSLMEDIVKIIWCSHHRGLRGFTSHSFAHSLASLCVFVCVRDISGIRLWSHAIEFSLLEMVRLNFSSVGRSSFILLLSLSAL